MESDAALELGWLDPSWCSAAVVLAACLLAFYCWAKAKTAVYVLDFSVFDPPDK
jgi:hypothetical protein